LSTGKLDIVLDKFQKMKDMTPEEAAEAFKVEDGAKALSMIDAITERAESIKRNYQEVSANYPNPYDPFRYKKGSQEEIAQSIGYNAWEDAKKNFIFARTEFENHTKRIQQLGDTLIGKRNPIKNANAQDLLALMDKNSLAAMVGSLKMDVKTADDSTAEGRKILNEKVKKLALVTSLAEGFENLSKATLGENMAEKNVVERELQKNFKAYLNHIAKQSGDFVFDSEVSDALNLIKDNYTLRDERASLVRSINVLNNPKGFLGLQRGLAEALIDIQANIPKNVAERQKAFATEAQLNKAVNQLFKESGATLTPEYMTSLYELLGRDELIELPKEYVFGEEVVTDVEDPRFKKAEEAWSKISKVIETDKPVEKKAQTREDIENELNTKLNAIKVDVMTLNVNDPFYTKDLSWAVTTKGVDERTTIVGALPFGEDHPLSLIEEDTYREDPKPIIAEYKNKLANFKEPVAEEPTEKKGRLIYATTGSGKSSAVRESNGEMVDVDDLLVAEIKKFIAESEDIKPVPEDEAAPTTIFNFAKNVSKEEKEALYGRVRNQIKELVEQGKTVLTGSTDFIKDADVVYTQTNKTGLSGSSLENLVARENTALKESGKTAIPLEGYITDKLAPIIRIAVGPSDGLIKRGIRFGFTKEQMNELTSTERAQVMTATEKADVQDLLDKYQKGVQPGKPDYDLIGVTVEGLKGKHVTIHNIVEGGRVDYFLYQNKDKEYVLVDYMNLNAPIAKSTESEADAIQKGFDILTGVEAEKADVNDTTKADIERRRQEGTNARGTTYKGETIEKDGLKVTKYSEFRSDGKRISKGGRIMTPEEFIEEYNITDQDFLDSLEEATEIRIYEVRVGEGGRSGISIQGTFPEGNIEMEVVGTELKALEQQPKSNQSEIKDKKADIEKRRQEELTTLKVGDSYDVISSTGSFDGSWTVTEITDKFYRLIDSKGSKLNMDKIRVEENLKRPDGVTETKYRKSNRDKINAKYDAELKVLEQTQPNIEAKKADVGKTLYGTISGSIPLSEALPNGIYVDLGNGLFAYADKNDKIAAIVDKSNGYMVSKSFWNANTNTWQLPNQANLKDDAKRLGIDESSYIKKYQDAVDSLNAKYDAELKALETKTTASSSKVVQTPSDIETQKADIERRRQGLNGVEEIIFNNPNFRLEGFEIDGNYWNVVTSTDRAKVLVNINGVIVPFYLTTGQAGKGLVPGWYPFFGIGKDGWLNKTDKSDMETYYERYWGKETADIVKSVSDELNSFYGTDPATFKNDRDPNATSRPLTTLADKVEDYINSKLSYTPAINNADARKTLRSNVEQLGKEINAKYDAKLAALKPSVEKVNIEAQLSDIASVTTFAEMDKVYDEVIKTMATETVENNELISKALEDKRAELMTTITPENLSSAKKKGYKIVIDNKIYPTFTVNKKKGTVSVKTPLGTKSQVFPVNNVEKITTMSAQPEITVSEETRQQVKDIVKTSSEIISDADLQKANEEAKTQKNEDINDDFFNNLGCK
jgi:hypothetical protein